MRRYQVEAFVDFNHYTRERVRVFQDVQDVSLTDIAGIHAHCECGVALGVQIDQKCLTFSSGEACCKVAGRGGLADATLLVGDSNYASHSLNPRIHSEKQRLLWHNRSALVKRFRGFSALFELQLWLRPIT